LELLPAVTVSWDAVVEIEVSAVGFARISNHYVVNFTILTFLFEEGWVDT